MKRLFAYAAMALAALILTTHSDAKNGSVRPHTALHHMHHHNFAHLHDFDRDRDFDRRHDFDRRRHRFAGDFLLGFPGYFDYGAPYYAASQIVGVPQESDYDAAVADPRRWTMWRSYGPNGCSTENVTVPASAGGETTVRVIRC